MLRRGLLALCFLLFTAASPAQQKPWPIRVVIMTTFEIGKDTGDLPGEFQLWAEREHLVESIYFPGGLHPILTNKEHTILGVVSGTTLVNATSSMMALGLDPRFDLSKTYFLINGIAGVNPEFGSIGTAAWANYVVGDISRFVDPREAPSDWKYGYFMIGAHEPNVLPPAGGVISDRVNVYALNQSLTRWAYRLTKDLKLMETAQIVEFRRRYNGFPVAMQKPVVLIGDTYASDSYWHGALMTKYADDWVKLQTGGKGEFVMTEMEDSGFAEALTRLSRMKRVDFNRVMVLRAGSNFCMPPAGMTAIESVNMPYIGTQTAVENAWLTGSTVVHELVEDWDRYAERAPTEQ